MSNIDTGHGIVSKKCQKYLLIMKELSNKEAPILEITPTRLVSI